MRVLTFFVINRLQTLSVKLQRQSLKFIKIEECV